MIAGGGGAVTASRGWTSDDAPRLTRVMSSSRKDIDRIGFMSSGNQDGRVIVRYVF